MVLKKFRYCYFLLIIFTFSCTSNKEEIEVLGADPRVDSNVEIENTNDNIDSEINIVDDISTEKIEFLLRNLLK